MQLMSCRRFLKFTGTTLAASSIAMLGFTLTEVFAEVRQYKLARATETRNTSPYCSEGCGLLMYGLGDQAKNAIPSIIHESVHTGRAAEVRKQRQAALAVAFQRTPNRFQ